MISEELYPGYQNTLEYEVLELPFDKMGRISVNLDNYKGNSLPLQITLTASDGRVISGSEDYVRVKMELSEVHELCRVLMKMYMEHWI